MAHAETITKSISRMCLFMPCSGSDNRLINAAVGLQKNVLQFNIPPDPDQANTPARHRETL